jgi:hypothetical protein
MLGGPHDGKYWDWVWEEKKHIESIQNDQNKIPSEKG